MRVFFLQQLNLLFPFNKLFKLLLAIALGVQLAIITYSHFSGYYIINNFANLFIRVLVGSSFMLIAEFVVTIPNLIVIRLLNQHFQWNSRSISRITIQFALTIIIALFGSTIITLFVNWVSTYKEDLGSVLVVNALIAIVLNILLVIILEAWLFFMESNKAKIKAELLERELSQIRFEVLKNQINPHFMFNSLNVLSGLIEKDTVKAQQFIDEFSQIYRYVLETIEKPVASLNEELNFIRSYLFLQQIRHGEFLTFSVNLPANLLDKLLPPLSLQVVLENAIKHNAINKSQPLHIDIYSEGNYLIVKNNIQPKVSISRSTGLGQSNLVKRYAIICENSPQFKVESNHYVVKLPLIQSDYDESPNH